jgi:hypothetical protein
VVADEMDPRVSDEENEGEEIAEAEFPKVVRGL